MDAITYGNIKISGINYNKICSLRIYQSVNNHAENLLAKFSRGR